METTAPVYPPTCFGAPLLADPAGTRRAKARALLRGIRDRLVIVTDWLATRTPAPHPRRGIAVIMPHGLGDLLLLTPALTHIRTCSPAEPVVLICSAAAKDYAELYVKPDILILIDRVRFRRDLIFRMRTLASIARTGTRIALQPSYNREHLIEDALVRATGADQRIGADGSEILISPAERFRGDRWYTRLVDSSPESRHESDYYGTFATAVTGIPPSVWLPRLPRPARHGAVPANPYMVLACQASSPVKAWPEEKFIAAAEAISAQTGLALVMVGSVPRPGSAARVNIVDLCGKTDLAALIAVLAGASVVLCNDSAPVHLAAALGVPAVAVCGGGIPDRYLPYPSSHRHPAPPRLVTVDPVPPCFGCGWRCRYAAMPGAPFACVAGVQPDRVVSAVLLALRSAPLATPPANGSGESPASHPARGFLADT